METNEIAIMLSVLATITSILSFFLGSWRSYRERARLRFGVSKVIQNNSDGRTFNQIEIKVTNVGLRPTILTGFKAIAENDSYYMGDTDPTAAAYGIAVDVFPAHLEPGGTIKFYPMSIEALERNQTDPKNPKHHYSPYTYFVTIDNFGKCHHIYVQDVLRALQMVKSWRPRTRWESVRDYFIRQRLFKRLKKQEY